MKKIEIGVIDNQTLFRTGLVEILNNHANFKVLFEVENGITILNILEIQVPEIIIIDLKIEPENGIHLVELIRKKHPDIKIIVLTTFYNTSFINLMTRVGINAFLSKQISHNELCHAINTVYRERIYQTEAYKDILLYSEGADIKALHSRFLVREKLSKRELEILNLICHEYTNHEISKKLFLSIRTVEGHRNNLLSKTGSKNTVGLVLYAIIYKLVEIDYKLLQISMQSPF
ncbi:response regulator transcription factor [Flavivirga jejuensis]|uniref:Response regulator transcription factor n=1 Tax=Flavivirga jejuensis TaxID=870487 RepID=A0ABT8WP24_9FLAO|nr:response regulator transcription factor [Flavivirga jejuensis]MDO5974911.1 response regulator transcription factor [Flavivirga jejuensis]